MKFKVVFLLLTVGSSWALKPLPKENAEGSLLPRDADDEAVWRLPTTVIPSHYDLHLKTHIEKFDSEKPETFNYEGTVKITVKIEEDISEIVLHGANLTINKATLQPSNNETILMDLDYNNYNETTNKLTLKLNPEGIISQGEYVISIDYTGTHGDDMRGFYRSYYVNEKGENKWLITTQFEAYDARRAFPCFDEPAFKANYDIKIEVSETLSNSGYDALSNTPKISEDSNGQGQKVYVFETTPKKISSYLVAFIVSDFNGTDTNMFENDSKPFRTWGQSRYILNGDAEISQISGPAAVDVISSLTSVPFGYQKIDQIGIPDFSAGAMENWGLITYRERMIFYNENRNPTSQKQSVVTTTVHELGHQWFGDLVTLHWWSDIWLNEGFATFFEYHATDQIREEKVNTSTWNMLAQMVVDELQAGAFVTDAQPNSRALTSEVYRPGDIDANFDDVAYSKGGSVLRMFMHTLGVKNFYTALNTYLTKHQENIGTPEYLLEEFKAVANVSLINPTEDFKNWHIQAGYPVLSVSRNGSTSTLTQERFLFTGDVGKNTWTVPISYTTSASPDFENTEPKAYFKSADKEIKIEHGDAAWVIFNVQQTGVYRVNYDEEGWAALTDLLWTDHEAIHEINRAQIVDDALSLAQSSRNYTDYRIALNITQYLANEQELIPWKAAINGFNFLYGKLSVDSVTAPKITDFILRLLKERFNILGLDVKEEDLHTQKLLRNWVVSWACKLGLPECVSQAKAKYVELESVHPDVKSTVICTNVREGNQEVWDNVWNTYLNTSDNAEQTILLSALGCARDEAIVRQYLEKTLDAKSGIRKQDLSAVFSAVHNGNPSNVAIALKFLQEKLDEIANAYGGGLNPLGGLLTGLANKLGSAEDVAALEQLRDTIKQSTNKNVIAAQTNSEKAVDIVKSNKAWLDEKKDNIVQWLDEFNSSSATTMSLTIFTVVIPTILALIYNF